MHSRGERRCDSTDSGKGGGKRPGFLGGGGRARPLLAAAAAASSCSFQKEEKKKDSPPLGSHGALDFTAQGLCHIGFSSSIVFRCERESSLLKGSENLEKEKRKKEKGKKL